MIKISRIPRTVLSIYDFRAEYGLFSIKFSGERIKIYIAQSDENQFIMLQKNQIYLNEKIPGLEFLEHENPAYFSAETSDNRWVTALTRLR